MGDEIDDVDHFGDGLVFEFEMWFLGGADCRDVGAGELSATAECMACYVAELREQ